ncbi:MAG: hypothetical protein AAFV25_18890, partial [Bacteroidota bacterium]
PDPALPTVSEGCGTLSLTSFDEISDDDCTRTVTRSYVITDQINDADTCQQLFTFTIDMEAPTFDQDLPMDTLVNCDAIPAAAVLTASDNCPSGATVDLIQDTVSAMTCPQEFVITRSWTATDGCGNTAVHTQTVTVQDTTAPVFVMTPANITLECDEAIPAAPTLMATDNCDAVVDVDFNEVRIDGSCAFNFVISRTWTATDDCDNTSTYTQLIRVRDTQAPQLACNNDLTITLDPGQCRTNAFRPVAFSPGDNCDLNPVVSQTAGPQPGDFLEKDSTYIFEFQAEDVCGNINSCSFRVFVQESPTTISSLPGNDLVNVVLDTTCKATITPDMVLEGGDFGCYEDYLLELYSDADLTNLLISSPCVTADQIGQEVFYQVTDPETGLSTWGRIRVEDKTAPRLACPCEQGGTPVSSVSGSIDLDDPSFIRPNNIGMNPGNCTLSGANTFYDRFDFTISEADLYTFSMPNLIGPDFFFALYQGGFDPTQACANLLATDDDSNGTEPEIMIQLTLVPGDYTLITTTFFANDPDGAYTYSISSANGGQVLTRDAACTVACFEDQNFPIPTATDACGIASFDSVDEIIDGGLCGNTTILRTWTATDLGGNTAVCTQEFTIEPGVVGDATAPQNYDGVDRNPVLLCENRCGGAAEMADDAFCGPSDRYWNVLPTGHPFEGHPNPEDGRTWPCGDVKCFGTGQPGGAATCPNINNTFEDTRINICTSGSSDGCYKIVRRWTSVDWCSGQIVNFTQNIKIEDNRGPIISDLEDVTLSTDVWRCSADWDAVVPWIEDNCSSAPIDYTIRSSAGEVVQSGGQWQVKDLPLGRHIITYTATDCCGNSSEETLNLLVIDDVPPVPVCERRTVVSIPATTGSSTGGLGTVQVDASVFDDGSFDNCSSVVFLARKINPICGSSSFRSTLTFCCQEIGRRVMVELLVWDEVRNRNTCMVEVEVQDKVPPFVVAPPDVTVTCDFWFEFDPDNPDEYDEILDETFGAVVEGSDDLRDRDSIIIRDRVCPIHPRFSEFAPASPFDDPCYDDQYDIFWGIDGYVLDNCDIDLEQTIIPNLTCGQGTITRRWQAADAQGNWSNIATQTITIINCREFYVPSVCWRRTAGDVGTCDFVSGQFLEKLIEWPCDIELSRCQGPIDEVFLPDNLDILLDQDRRPRFADDNCSLI